jgi:hypothetical protein
MIEKIGGDNVAEYTKRCGKVAPRKVGVGRSGRGLTGKRINMPMTPSQGWF